jgi:diguanylate cyclase (GGDEF)-like protein/PAS domain S-box-containing protein
MVNMEHIQQIIDSYNLFIILFSVVIAILASYSAFDLYLRTVSVHGQIGGRQLISGAVALGIGIWCMHITGTLAYKAVNQLQINYIYILLSLLIAILGAFLSLSLFYRTGRAISSSILMSLSIGTMHFIGMESLRSDMEMVYHYPLLAGAGLVGFLGAYFSFRWLQSVNPRDVSFSHKIRCGAAMGLAVSGLHYIAMISMPLSPVDQHHLTPIHPSADMTVLAAGVGGVTLLLLLLVVVASYTGEKLTIQSLKLKTNEQHYQSLYHHNPDMVLTFDVEGIIVNANHIVEYYGYTEEELLHQSFVPYVLPDQLEKTMEHFHIARQGKPTNYETSIYSKEGDRCEVNVTNIPIVVDDNIVGVYGIIKDITARKKAEETIEYMAYHDDLTELPNRYHFCERLRTALSDPNMNNLALLFINLDQFKFVNDAMGHEIGNRLLKAVSMRLKEYVQTQGDVARNDGDEFLVSLPNMNQEEAFVTAKGMLDSLSEPFHIAEYELFITPSIGISLYPQDGEEIEDLIKKADSAMYQAKRSGKNNIHFYTPNHWAQTYGRYELETNLRKALERNEFQLHYQPKFDLTSGKITGVEALIRWEHPTKGSISPGEFIPLAEEMGLIVPIGEWVLHTACMQNKAWQETGLPPLEVAVNLSVRQLYQPNLVDSVKMILEETGLPPEYLELEITESMLMDSDHALKVLKELKKVGVKISLDDFGTGFSSLHYLMEAPVHKIKIDQSFIRRCTMDMNHATVVKTIIAMAHQLKMEVNAEGVETKEQLIFLQQNLCNEAQGFLFSKPLPPREFVQQLAHMEQITHKYGIPEEMRNDRWMERALEIARQELVDTVRQQHGMTFKFVKEDGKFIHTLCDGQLLYRMGLVPEKIVGKELSDFLQSHDVEAKLPYYNRAWEGETNVAYEGESNGVSYLASLRPVISGGKVVEVIASCVDITERKVFEEALRMSETFLRKSEKLSLVGQLAAGVAHEIRNPLTSVKGFLQLMQEEVKPNYIAMTLAEIDHMEEIIKEFLTLAKPQVTKIIRMNSKTLLQNAVTLFGAQAIMNNVEIIEEYDSDLPQLDCDGNNLKQVFINILQNAVESMPNGGIIKIQAMRFGEEYIQFRFCDQGHGIPADRLDKLGEPFYSTKEKGMGLGLMVSYKIVQEHKGTININSTVNEGTTIEVVLPIRHSLVHEAEGLNPN